MDLVQVRNCVAFHKNKAAEKSDPEREPHLTSKVTMSSKFRSVLILLSIFTMMVMILTTWWEVKTTQALATKGRRDNINHNMVIVISEARSGSTFLAEMVASPSWVFYFFEPLHKDVHKMQNQSEHFVRQTLNDLLTCNISSSLKEAILKWRSIVNNQVNLNKCKPHCQLKNSLIESCRTKDTKVIKTIRTRVAWLDPLLHSLPDLQIIHVVRDPRGTLHSIFNRGWIPQNATESIRELCENIQDDLHQGTVLERRYSERYLLVRYEDLCKDPWGEAARIFDFLGHHPLPSDVNRFLLIHTNGTINRDPYSAHRNTVTMGQQWRTTIPPPQLQTIESLCAPLISQLGFRLFESLEDVRNLSIPLYNNPTVNG